jgi:hypothetical protein
MQTGSSGTLIGWKSGQTTFVPLWDRIEGAWLRTQERDLEAQNPISHPPPSYTVCIHCTVYVYTLLRAPTTVYVLIHTRLNQREGMRGNTSQSWVKNKKMTFIT